MKTVIITGAGGFIGSQLTKKMVENEIKVIAISKEFGPFFPNNSLIERIESEIWNHEQLLSVIPIGNYEAFYHLAWLGVNGPQKADPLVQIENIKFATICASVANIRSCKKFLCAGTVAERAVESLSYLDKVSGGLLYGVSKYSAHLILETYCKSIGLQFVWMQFSNIYGPGNKTRNLVSYTLGEIMNNREATFGPALQPYDFVYIDDLVEAVYRLGIKQTNSNQYFIGSGTPRILKEYLVEIGNLCQRSKLIKIGKRKDDGIKYTMEMFSNSKLVEDIGDYVNTSFTDGIKNTVKEY